MFPYITSFNGVDNPESSSYRSTNIYQEEGSLGPEICVENREGWVSPFPPKGGIEASWQELRSQVVGAKVDGVLEN